MEKSSHFKQDATLQIHSALHCKKRKRKIGEKSSLGKIWGEKGEKTGWHVVFMKLSGQRKGL